MEKSQSFCSKLGAHIRLLLSLALVFMLFSACSTPRLTLKISTASPSIGANDPLVLKLELASDDRQALQVLNAAFLEHYPYSFFITDGSGRALPYLGPDLSIDYSDAMFTVLQRGESLSHHLNLEADGLGEKRYDFSKPGIYSIRARYRSPGNRYQILSNTLSVIIR